MTYKKIDYDYYQERVDSEDGEIMCVANLSNVMGSAMTPVTPFIKIPRDLDSEVKKA
jgi:hypothetical protein